MKNYFKLKHVNVYLILTLLLLITSSCKEKEGCTDPLSYTYDSEAEKDDGSCSYYYGGKDYGQLDVASMIDTDNEYDIYIDGISVGRLLYYFPNGVSCGNPQTVGRIVSSGYHTVTAVGNGGTVVREGSVYLAPQECNVILIEDLPIDNGGGGGGGTSFGDVSFWTSSDLGCGNIYLSINSLGSGTISYYYTSNPGCGASGCANFFDIPYGSYSYTASSDGGCTWNGVVSLSSSCNTLELTSGGGGGGGTNYGDVTFWTASDLGCGNLYVSLNSVGSGTIGYYYYSNPGCGASGCANFFDVPYGSYYYSVSSDYGCTWSGYINVTSSCNTLQLYLNKAIAVPNPNRKTLNNQSHILKSN